MIVKCGLLIPVLVALDGLLIHHVWIGENSLIDKVCRVLRLKLVAVLEMSGLFVAANLQSLIVISI